MREPTDKDLEPFGWALGDYCLRCPHCRKKDWNCSKYARRCRECAVKAFVLACEELDAERAEQLNA